MPWQHPEDATLAMPINTLAMEILRDFKTQGGWNRDNWIKESQQSGTAKSDAVARALAEGWAWLESRGLVAWNPNQSSPNARFITRLGEEALSEGVSRMDASTRLGMQLHPRIAEAVERQFLLGEYEMAVFAAMRDVEIRVRELTGSPDGLLGVKLMQKAFSSNDPAGTLTDAEADPGEQVATMQLFTGAMGTFKNPTSHRPVDYDDSTEAAEIVLFADLLHRMLDRIERRLQGDDPSRAAQAYRG